MPSSHPENSEEPSGLLYTLAAFSFGVLLGLFLSKLRAPNHDSGSSSHHQHSTDDATDCGQNLSPRPLRVIVDSAPPTPTPNDERDAREKNQERRDKKRFGVEKGVAVILFIYTAVTVGMWWYTREAANAAKGANENAHQALIRSNRPWIGQSTAAYFADKPTVTANSVESAGITIEIHNFGTSPALHVNMYLIPDVMNPPSSPETFFQQSDNDIKAACRMADMATKETQGFAYAGGKQAQIKNPAGGQTIFPNGSVSYLMPINLQIGQGTTEGHGLDLFGCIAYRDQFDETVHHTTFCYMTTEQMKDVKANERPQPCGINQNAD